MDEHRNTSNQLAIDINKIEASNYSEITKEVVRHFNLEANNEIVKGLNEIFQEFKSGRAVIGLEWDNWSGYIVNAKNREAEPLAKVIAAFINENY